MSAAVHLRILSREGCGLCHELVEALEVEFGPRAFELEWLDVDSRVEWKARWGLVVPVLLDAHDTVLSETRLDAERVAAITGCRRRDRRTR
ncbi:MAG: glutaredoxin family protein [Nevskiaceae bacterium]|nr:MAG: glutaredoxin family protein [Nevskiaceae bacterium]TBR73984.1 MAG: glutaredoxin family protein [Nevskiaceae bacterium]